MYIYPLPYYLLYTVSTTKGLEVVEGTFFSTLYLPSTELFYPLLLNIMLNRNEGKTTKTLKFQ